MISQYFLSFAIVVISFAASGQADTLNQFDSSGKKTGWWIIYLDEHLGEVKNADEAHYYRYAYFKGRFNYQNMGPIGSRKHPVIPPESEDNPADGPTLLHGEYKTLFDNGQTQFLLKANNGKLTEYREYYKDGTLRAHFDYMTSCGDTPFLFCIYEYKRDGSLKYKGTIRVP